MHYWLLKSEPDVWSISQQRKAGKKGVAWDGVRNYQARNNLKKMKLEDQFFFYHTGDEKKIVGIGKVIKEFFPDKKDKTGRFGSIMVRSQKSLKVPVSLNDIKNQSLLAHLSLLKQSRLSVMPIDSKSWKIICKMGRIT